jgi:hypothetical protein
MSLFCDHDWQSRTGMDSGSYCTKCTATSSREVDVNKSGGLNNGTLESRIDTVRKKYSIEDKKDKKNLLDIFRI